MEKKFYLAQIYGYCIFCNKYNEHIYAVYNQDVSVAFASAYNTTCKITNNFVKYSHVLSNI